MAIHQLNLRKMDTFKDEVVRYELQTHEGRITLNDYIGTEISIVFDGTILCLECQKRITKTYAGGFCFQCMQTLPQADMCMVKPELCHFDRGTCRDSKWGKSHCFTPHIVYLAKSSAIKVGITRENPPERRWMDQGAIEAMAIAEVPDRKTSGLIEIALAKHIDDKTDFRKMLRGETVKDSLDDMYQTIIKHVPDNLTQHLIQDRKLVSINYPLNDHPDKIKTQNLDKQNRIQGKLLGIKGQYLIFEDFVFNVRAHSGYEVSFEGSPNPNPQSFEPKEEEPSSLFDFF